MTIATTTFDINQHLKNHSTDIEAWFRQQWQQAHPPLYGSIDLRNAHFKLAPVDTNLFPAGFNNLNPDNMALYVQAMQATIAEICPDITQLLIIPESHTRNLFYFESLAVLQTILSEAGFEVRIGSVNPTLTKPEEYQLPSGRSILLEPLVRKGQRVMVENFSSCCILLNNDLSDGIPDILQGIEQNIMPSTQLGWTTRLKSAHFRYYQTVCESFSQPLDLDPWLIMPYFDQCSEIDFNKKSDQASIMTSAHHVFQRIQKKYQTYGITHKPFLVIKADQGTYGMAVMMIDSPDQLNHLNRKQRQQMSKTKGGARVSKIIIQEGIHTFETAGADNAVAEPVIYTIGRHVIGGFYRLHKKRGPRENLNSPGMDFEPLAFDSHCRMYAYSVIARLALLAAAKELATLTQLSENHD